jgi:hypothetical protein
MVRSMPPPSLPHDDSGFERPTADMLRTARVILYAVSNPSVALSIGALATATGLTAESVREVLKSPIYLDLIHTHFKMQVTSALSRGIDAMDKLVHNDQARDADRVSAYKSIVQTYAAVAGHLPKQEGGNADTEFKAALKILNDIQKPDPKGPIAS